MSSRAGSTLLAAAVTGAWAAVVSFAPVLAVVLLGWFGSATVSGGTAVRFALAAWLLAHGVPVTAPHGPVSLAPLTLTALVVWRLARAGAHTARAVGATPRNTGSVVAALALCYGVLGSVAAFVASQPGFAVSPWRASLTTGVLAALASAPAALAETGAAAALWRRWPAAVREGVRGGLLAATGILAAGAVLAGVATVLAYQDAVDLYRGYRAGAVGGAGITLVGLLYSPNATVWAASYLLGPGFQVGAGTAVRVFEVSLGPLPAVPLLAGLPTGPAPPLAGALLTVPVVAGLAVGVAAARRSPGRGPGPLLGAALVAGLVAGTVLAAASGVASGSLGGGRLSWIGAAWWLVGPAAAVAVAVPAALSAAAARLLLVGR